MHFVICIILDFEKKTNKDKKGPWINDIAL